MSHGKYTEQVIEEYPSGPTPQLPYRGVPEVGPKYKRGRGWSFFKNTDVKGNKCQGMEIYMTWGRNIARMGQAKRLVVAVYVVQIECIYTCAGICEYVCLYI